MEKKYQDKRESDDVKTLKLLLETGKMGEAEEQITPEDLMKWLEANDKDINERVMYLHNLFDAIEEIERLHFKLE